MTTREGMGMTAECVAPEEVMAWVDGELPASEAQAMAMHVEQCAECAGVAAGFRRMSEQLAEWRVEEVSERVGAAVMERAGEVKEYPHGRPSLRSGRTWGTRYWGRWVMGLGAAATAVVLVVVSTQPTHQPQPMPAMEMRVGQPQPLAAMDSLTADRDKSTPAGVARQALRMAVAPPPAASAAMGGGSGRTIGADVVGPGTTAPAPMIARTVSLTMRVQDAVAARSAVEVTLARHHGYMAQMNASGGEGSARMLQASLRIPAPELAAALRELRTMGRVESESQSGEEVSAQHEDLVARLKNARETETRLQAILEQRTGRISDVLEVEQEIARVRGEIESMEAEQAGLEHRVEFASVEVSAMEEYKAPFSSPDSVGTRMRNAFVAGYRNAGETLLGFVLFFEEYGPALLVWAVVLGVPGVWVWRRYRKIRSTE